MLVDIVPFVLIQKQLLYKLLCDVAIVQIVIAISNLVLHESG